MKMLKLLLLCFWIRLVATDSNLNLSLFTDTAFEDEIAACVSPCIRKVIELISEQEDFPIDVTLMNVKNAIDIVKLHGIKNARFVTRTFSWIHSQLFTQIYVTHCDNFNEFKTGIHDAMNDAYFNPGANFIIVMDNFRHLKTNITNFLVLNNIFNVTIIGRREYESEYKIYTFDSPIHPCNHHESVIKIGHCSNYTGGSDIFPKMEGIRGCRFRLIGYNYFPLINFDDQYEGTEQRIIQIFEAYAGVKFDLIQFSKMDKYGRLVGNFTYVDLLNKVQRNEYKGAIGGYFLYFETVKKLSFAYPLSIDYLVPIMRRARFYDTWHAFFQQGNIAVMLVFVLIGLFSTLAHFLSLFHSQRTDPVRNLLIVFGLFLSQSFLHKFKTGIAESLVVCSLLFAIFIIPYTLQAFMSSAKTHPIRGHEPKDLDEIIKNYNIIGPSEWPRQGIGKFRKDCESRLKCLKKVKDSSDNLRYYTLMETDLFEAYKWMVADEQCNSGVYRVNEPVSTLMRTIYFQKGSVLVKPFNQFYYRLMSSGIITQHYREIMERERMKCKSRYKSVVVATSLKDLKGPYTLLVGGICTSILVFAYEVYKRKI